MAKYSLALLKQAKTGKQKVQVFRVMEQAVRRGPDRDDVRRPLAKLAMELGATKEAVEHLNYLLDNKSPKDKDPELEDQRGQCFEASGDLGKAEADYRSAKERAPHQVDSYIHLASVMQRELKDPKYAERVKDPKDVERVLNEMVAKNPDSFQALVARGRYYREIGMRKEAAADMAAARTHVAPDDVDQLLASADIALEEHDTESARRNLNAGLQSHPDEPRFHVELAALDLQTGPEGRTKALKHLEEAQGLIKGKPVILLNVADLYIDAGETAKAREVLDALGAEGSSPLVDYLKARLDFSEGKVASAAALLEERHKDLNLWPEVARRADGLLGLCYQKLGNPDQQLAAFRRAVQDSSVAAPAVLLGRASALAAVGKFDEALVEYNDLVKKDAHLLEARIQTIRLMIDRARRVPSEKPDWAAVETLLNTTPEDQRKLPEVRLSRINFLLAKARLDEKGRLDAARKEESRKLLDEARKQIDDDLRDDPKEIRYWVASAALADYTADPSAPKDAPKSLEILDQAEKALSDAKTGQPSARDQVSLRLERAGRVIRLNPDEAMKRLHAIEKGADDFDVADRVRLLTGLTDAYRRVGASDEALRLCQKARDLAKDDLRLLLWQFDLSVATKVDTETLKSLVDQVRELEGTEGATWRCCEATRMILLARAGDTKGLIDAQALLTAAAKRRPTWSRPLLLQAEVEELSGDVNDAIAKYKQAIDLGENSPEAIGQAATLLVQHGRPEEAKRLLENLGDEAVLLGDGLGRLAVLSSLQSHQSNERTLDLATREAAKNPKDYRSQLWLGEVCWAMHNHGQAEEAFRRALKLEPAAPETWKALVLCLVDGGHKDLAATELENAQKALPAEQVTSLLAVGYEALGQRDKGEEQYLAALTAKPDAAHLREAAAFYLRGGDVKKAEPLLHRIIDKEGRSDAAAVAWARRSLALAWASSGDFKQSQDALDLIAENLHNRQTPEDQRVKALVLASRPGGRGEAIKELEASFAVQRATPDEEFLLARLYEANGAWDQANLHYLSVATAKEGATPVHHLAHYILALLRHKDVNGAARYLKDLEKSQPDAFRTLAVKARVLKAQEKGMEAEKLLEDYANKAFADKKEPVVLRDTAMLLEDLSQTDKAGEFYRKYIAEVEGKQPEQKVLLAGFLARRDQLSAALDILDALWDTLGPSISARNEVAVLRVGHPTPQHFQRVQAKLQDAVQSKPNQVDLLVSLADLQDAQGRHDEAMKSYRTILAGNPRNPLALNNLAWLLAVEAGKPAEALPLIEQAIEVAGPSAQLLDTQGIVLLKKGEALDAVRVLSKAAEQSPAATVYFHLAQAQKAAHSNDAERAWLKAVELGLKETDLHPLERADYQKWLAERKEP